MWKQSFPETSQTGLTHKEDTQLQTALKEIGQS